MPRSGKIAICINDGKVLIKRIKKWENKVVLVSTNSEYTPPILAPDGFRSVGEVTADISFNFD